MLAFAFDAKEHRRKRLSCFVVYFNVFWPFVRWHGVLGLDALADAL